MPTAWIRVNAWLQLGMVIIVSFVDYSCCMSYNVIRIPIVRDSNTHLNSKGKISDKNYLHNLFFCEGLVMVHGLTHINVNPRL